MSDGLIRNVSDTARWVAAYRADESKRPDAVFRDHLAERLAGKRGYEIASKSTMHTRWAIVARTKVIDDLVVRSVAQGTDRVLNLAAGFDTRPYRLDLPPTLSWIEADLPELIDEKEALCAGETPRCGLIRERVDLTDSAARTELFRRAAGGGRRVLVLTEGLVMYLTSEMVAELARALYTVETFRRWIVDFSSPKILEIQQQSMRTSLVQAPLRFAPADGVGFFEGQGWRARDIRSLMREATRLRRTPAWMRLLGWLPQPNPRSGAGRWSVVVQFERPGAATEAT